MEAAKKSRDENHNGDDEVFNPAATGDFVKKEDTSKKGKADGEKNRHRGRKKELSHFHECSVTKYLLCAAEKMVPVAFVVSTREEFSCFLIEMQRTKHSVVPRLALQFEQMFDST